MLKPMFFYFVLLLTLMCGIVPSARAAPTDLYYALIMGTWMSPLPIFAVKAAEDGSLGEIAEVEMYSFTEGDGTAFLGTVMMKTVTNAKEDLVLETSDGVTPHLKLTIDRRSSYMTAPFLYTTRVVGGVLPVQDRSTYMARQLNPLRPDMDTAVGAMLASKIQGRLAPTCSSLFASASPMARR